MEKNKSFITLGLCFVILFLSFTGSSRDFLPVYRNNKSITLKVLSWISEPRGVLKTFERKYKNIKVEWIQVNYSDYYSELNESIQDPDKCPDLVLIELPLLNYYANEKQLMNLSKMGADLYFKEMFEKWLWNASGRIEIVPIMGGPGCYSCAKIPTEPRLQVYGLPYILGPAVLFYDEKFLKKNSLSIPKDWDDFEKISEKFSKASYDKKILAFPNDPWFLIGFSWGNGEKVLSYLQNRDYFNFDTGSLNKLFEHLQNIYNRGLVEFLSLDQIIERFNEFTFVIAPQWFTQYLDDLKFTSVPLLKRNSKIFDFITIALSIPKNSANPVESFLLAGWLTCSKHSQSQLRKAGLIPPINYTSLKLKNINLRALDGPDETFLYPDILKKIYDEILNCAISSSTNKLSHIPRILQKELGDFFNDNKYLLLSPLKTTNQ